MPDSTPEQLQWHFVEVRSPQLTDPIPVVAARDIPYVESPNRFQNLTIYLPRTPQTSELVGTPVASLLPEGASAPLPRLLVHIHGGAWRDPQLTSASIEAAVAHAFSAPSGEMPVQAIASINYTLSQFPTHPQLPYDAIRDNHSDPSREAIHPQHLNDVLHGLALLRSGGLDDGSYVLSGHSAGATLAAQAVLESPEHYGLPSSLTAPRPAALLGMNGLYDLPALVTGLGASHEHLADEYEMLLSEAFGPDNSAWSVASPARVDPTAIAERVRAGLAPTLVVLDQSDQDQLVPMNQRERLEATLRGVSGVRVVEGHRCTGTHAAPWEQGLMLWQGVEDVIRLLGANA